MDIATKAIEYSKLGLSIHLLKPMQKTPVEKEWSTIANLSVKDLFEEFKENPHANVGVRLGEFSKIDDHFLYVLNLEIASNDLDDIEAAYKELANVYKDFDKLPVVRTSSKNSRQFYFMSKAVLKSKKLTKSKSQITVQNEVKNSWEIELMSTYKQVIIPPSVYNNDKYFWERDILEYLNDDSKKALMIINDLKLLHVDLEESKNKYFDNSTNNMTLTAVKAALDTLEESYLNNEIECLKIGIALHQEYADTDKEQEALALWDDWSKKSETYEKSLCFQKWKTFNKRHDGITISNLLQHLPKKKINKMELFSKYINSNNKIDFDSLKETIKEIGINDLEVEVFIEDIAKSLSFSFGKKFTPVQVRKVLSAFRKEEKEQKEADEDKLPIGLDHTLSVFVLRNCFADGKYLINQNENVFFYKNGQWRPIEVAELSRITLEEIERIYTCGSKEFEIINKIITKKKKNDDLNGLTNQVVNLILKKCSTSAHEDILNLQQKKEFRYSVINTLNKEIYIEDGKVTVEDHKYDSYLMSQLNVEYDPDADCPNFKLALNNVFQDLEDKEEVIKHYMECWGLSIQSKKENFPLYCLLLGGGENGKSFIVKQTQKVVGMNSCLNVSINKFTQGAHAEASLLGKLLLIDDDFKKNDVVDDGFLKKTSETVPITANPKFKNEITFYSNCTSWILANGNPKSKDVSHGMSRRAQCFPFTHTFTDDERDTKLGDKIALERPGILNLMIKSYLDLVERGKFLKPKSCEMAKNKWIKASNALLAFIDEKCIVTGDYTDNVKGNHLYEKYKAYVENENASYAMTRNNFYDDIASIKNIRTRVHSADKNMYIEGIKLR